MNKLYFGFFLTLLLVPSMVFAEFDKVKPGKEFQFPRDHGAHPNYPVEWWYFTGHLQGQNDQSYGFELTFFRVAVNRTERARKNPWHTQSLYLAHAALTDDASKSFYFEKRSVRPSFGRASSAEDRLAVQLEGWKVEQLEDEPGKESFSLVFDAIDEKTKKIFSLELTLRTEKLPVLQGKGGYSQKGDTEDDASYYISFTRLGGEGYLAKEGAREPVTVSAWMDHEILSSQPNDESVGWDWFAIQFENGWECMLYHLRRGKEGEISRHSSGSCVDPTGEKTALTLSDYQITPIGSWRSPHTKIRYPAGWNVEIPSLEIAVSVTPTVADQELAVPDSPTRSYWEGRNSVRGKMKGQSVSGQAYVELVGYQP